MPRVIAVVSSKGGVGKTALAQNLGAELAQLNHQVLLVDFDPQHHLTRSWGIVPHEVNTVYDAMLDLQRVRECVYPVRPCLDILPANMDLAGAELFFINEVDRNHKLQDVLNTIQSAYDFVLIDGPPSLGFFTVNALVAANEVFIPLQPHVYAFEALDQLLDVISKVRRINPSLQLTAIVLSMYDKRNTLTLSIEREVRERFSATVTQTVIPINIRIVESTLDYKSVREYEPTSTGAHAYQQLAQEVVARE